MKQKFNLGQILTLVSGKFFTESWEDLYEVISFLVGYSCMTHELGKIINSLKPLMQEKFVNITKIANILANVKPTKEEIPKYMELLKLIHGNEFELEGPYNFENGEPILCQ